MKPVGLYHFDDHGNPVGRAYDLGGVDDDRLRGERILLYVAYTREPYEWDAAQAAVSERQVAMDIVVAQDGQCPLDARMLARYAQLWLVSDSEPTMTPRQIRMVCDFVRRGGGLLLWADNDPYYQDANAIADLLIGTRFSGNRLGEGIMYPSPVLTPGTFIAHPLTQGVNALYEGHTICTITPAPQLTILAQSHDEQLCMACYEHDNQRIVLDAAFTKLAPGSFEQTAGTARYFRNIAFWLSQGARGVEYVAFTPGLDAVATIGAGVTSERYAHTLAEPAHLPLCSIGRAGQHLAWSSMTDGHPSLHRVRTARAASGRGSACDRRYLVVLGPGHHHATRAFHMSCPCDHGASGPIDTARWQHHQRTGHPPRIYRW